MNRKALATTVILTLAVAGFYAYKQFGGQIALSRNPSPQLETMKADSAPLVSVVKARLADFKETVLVSGNLVAREEVLITPEVDGLRIVELFADEGSKVTKGQVLARLVSDSLDAQLAQNDAANARSDAAIAQARSNIVQAEARAREAAAQLDRAEPLKKSGYLSGSTYDARESAADTTKAQVVAARDALRAAEAEKAQVAAQRRELDWRRSNTEVKSPANGVVSRRVARIGALASSASEPMFRVIANNEIELDAEIIETDLVNVKVGQKVRVTAAGAEPIDGTVRIVSPEVDKTTRLGRVRVFLGNRPELKIGAFARGTIDTRQSHGVALPATAISYDVEGAHILVVKNDHVQRRAVKTGLTADGLVEILDGIAPDETVVARAGTFLRDGDKIRAVEPANTISQAKDE